MATAKKTATKTTTKTATPKVKAVATKATSQAEINELKKTVTALKREVTALKKTISEQATTTNTGITVDAQLRDAILDWAENQPTFKEIKFLRRKGITR